MTQPSTYDVFVSYADADRAWVEGYLLDALKQAGVRYHSEAAFAPGAPRLLEFERAIKQSQRTLLVLSPAYLTDTFSQFADLLAQTFGLGMATWQIIPLVLHPVLLPPRLSMLTALDATNAESWPSVIERLCHELHLSVPDPAPRLECPYPGMVPFRAEDARFFFGREAEIAHMLEFLHQQRMLFVVGPSGSGKSSLVHAGLLPRLVESNLFPKGYWLVRSLRPSASDLLRARNVTGQYHSQISRWVNSLLTNHPPAQQLLLVIDQFEELFALADNLEQRRFIAVLNAIRSIENCTLLIVMRADFYPDLMNSDLWPIDASLRMEIGALRGSALRQAIERPAEEMGVRLEPGLVERLLADAADEPGVLPLVQETMVLLWERMARRLLPLTSYELLDRGGQSDLAVAIARRADAALAELLVEQQAIARRIFLRLVQFGEGRPDTRRQQPLVALRAATDDPLLFERTLQHLTSNRLLTLSGQEGDTDRKVDIAHEALITNWPTLRTWLAERREAEQIRRRLEEKTTEWRRFGYGEAALLDSVELFEAERWLSSGDASDLGYSQSLAALVERSRAITERAEKHELQQAQTLAEELRQRVDLQTRVASRLRRLLLALLVLTLLVLALLVVLLRDRGIAQPASNFAGWVWLTFGLVLAISVGLTVGRVIRATDLSLNTIIRVSPITILKYRAYRARWAAGAPVERLSLLLVPSDRICSPADLVAKLADANAPVTPPDIQSVLEWMVEQQFLIGEKSEYRVTEPVLHRMLLSREKEVWISSLAAHIREEHPLVIVTKHFLQAAGYHLTPVANAALAFICHAGQEAQQTRFSMPIYIRVIPDRIVDRAAIHDVVAAAGLNRKIIFIAINQTPDDSAWIEIGACRAEGAQVIPLPDTLLREAREAGNERESLEHHLQGFMGRQRDLYNVRDPVVDRLSFFGRMSLAEELLERLSASEALAILGLRKIGKSSLLYYLRNQAPYPVAVVDLQTGTDLPGLYRRVLRGWQLALRVRLPEMAWQPPPLEENLTGSFVGATLDLLDQLSNRLDNPRLALFVDEIDLIMPRAGRATNEYLDFMRAVRGLIQETGQLSLLVAGVSATFNRLARLGNESNPVYQFFDEIFLPPLSFIDCAQMVRNIGRQMGLGYSDEAIDLAVQQTGGHPFLARQLCSLAYRDGGMESGEVPVAAVQKAADSLVREPSTASFLDEHGIWGEMTRPELWQSPRLAEINREVLLSLAQQQPLPVAQLSLDQGDPIIWDRALAELRSLSILTLEGTAIRITFAVFRSWIRLNKLGLAQAAVTQPGEHSPPPTPTSPTELLERLILGGSSSSELLPAALKVQTESTIDRSDLIPTHQRQPQLTITSDPIASMTETQPNPFRFNRPSNPMLFVGPVALVQAIARDLADHQGDSHGIIGGRRIGKSSLLLALQTLLEFKLKKTPSTTINGDGLQLLPIFFDFTGYSLNSPSDFFSAIVHLFWRRIKIFYPDIEMQTSVSEDIVDIEFLLDKIDKKLGPTRLVLLLDEVDATLRDTPAQAQILFGQIRALVSAGELADRVRVVLAGSSLFHNTVTERGSPLLNILQLHYLGAFDEHTAQRLIGRAGDMPLAIAEIVWTKSGGHPFIIQYLMHYLWVHGVAKAVPETVELFTRQFCEERVNDLKGWRQAIGWAGEEVYEQLVSDEWLSKELVVQALRERGVDAAQGLQSLCYHGLVIHDGTWTRYRRVGKLFYDWLEQQPPRHHDLQLGMDRVADVRHELQMIEYIQRSAGVADASDTHTLELIVTYLRRLDILENQRAYHGMSTPAAIILEIEDTVRMIASLKRQLKDATHISSSFRS